ncbi:MAG: VCBS repeat-containing protein [Myxococcales bacterium]|nr:VCBS repeat-containing protein [Myxococcales bacterium]
MNASRWLVSSVACALVSACTLPGNIDDASVRQVEDTGVEDVTVEDVADVTTDRPVFDAGGPDTPSPTDTGVDVRPDDVGTCPATLRPPTMIGPVQGAVLAAAEALLEVGAQGATSVEFRVGDTRDAAAMASPVRVPVVDGRAELLIPYNVSQHNRPRVWFAVARCGTISSAESRSSFRFGTRLPEMWRRNTFSRIEYDATGDGRTDLLIAGSEQMRLGGVVVAIGGTTAIQPTSIPGLESTIYNVHALGDVNGNGFGDALVQRSTGFAIYDGGGAGIESTPIVTVTSLSVSGMTSNSSLGRAVAPLGDIDRDGRADFAVADFDKVFIVLGNAIRTGGTTLVPSAVIDIGSSYAGIRSLAAGDFDGDGFVDLAVATPGAFSNSGRVLVYRNVDNRFPAASATREISAPALTQFGFSMTTGVFRNDYSVDLLVGALPRTSPTVHNGMALVYRRPLDGTVVPIGALPPVTLTPTHAYGYDVATGGDIDANGTDEFAVLAQNYAGTATGAAFVFEAQSEVGSPPMARHLFTLSGGAGENYRGSMVSLGTYASTTGLGFAFGHIDATVSSVMGVGAVYIRQYISTTSVRISNTLTFSTLLRGMGQSIAGG